MIGSLQEFIGDIDRERFLSNQKREKRCSQTLRTRSLERSERERNRESQNGYVSTIKIANTTKIKYHNPTHRDSVQHRQRKDSEKSSKNLDRSLLKSKWTEHIADDKHHVLKAFSKLKRSDDGQRNSKLLEQLRQTEMKNRTCQTSKPKTSSFLHLKGNLKHDHQLLRSIIRVEEQDLINPMTFLELSLENMTHSINQIKIKPVLEMTKQQYDKIHQTLTQSQLNSIDRFTFKSQALPSTIKPSALGLSRSVNHNQRILIQNAHKWARSRAKSTKCYEKTLGIAQIREEKESQKRLKSDRKEIFKKISDLITRPPPNLRKNSLRLSSRFFG